MTAELKPCPFCGENPMPFECKPYSDSETRWYWTECRCGVEMKSCDTREAAYAMWNRRSLATPPLPVREPSADGWLATMPEAAAAERTYLAALEAGDTVTVAMRRVLDADRTLQRPAALEPLAHPRSGGMRPTPETSDASPRQ